MYREVEGGILLPVRVIPHASKEEIVGWHEGRLKIKVSAPAEKGAANRAVVCLLSKTLGIRQHRIVLVKGETSRQKDFLLIDATSIEMKLD